MADDSQCIDEPFDFHPANIPSGLKNYNLKDLTPEQQEKLNELKQEEIKNNHKYLNKHPEVRGLLVTILKILLYKRPNTFNIHETIAKYFIKPASDIRDEIEEYIRARNIKVSKGSSLDLKDELEDEKEEEKETEVLREIRDIVMPQSDILLPRSVKSNLSFEDNQFIQDKAVDEIGKKLVVDEAADDADLDHEISISSLLNIEAVGDLPVDYDDHIIETPEHSSDSEDDDDN